jgi:excisionase family DNA binding protein
LPHTESEESVALREGVTAVTVASVPAADEGTSDVVGSSKAAELLGVSQNRIRQLINAGQLPAQRVGRTFVIRRHDVDVFAALPPGRPRHPRRVR